MGTPREDNRVDESTDHRQAFEPANAPAQSIDSGASHTQQVILFPTPLGQDALRGILEEFAKEQQAHGRPRFRLTQTIFGHDGPAFIMEGSYESVSELEAV